MTGRRKRESGDPRKRAPRRLFRGTDPRRAGGDAASPGGPFDRNSVVIDTTDAVLLDSTVAALAHFDDRDVVTLVLSGRINRTTERARVAFLMDEIGAADVIAQLVGLGARAGGTFGAALMAAIDTALDAQPKAREL